MAWLLCAAVIGIEKQPFMEPSFAPDHPVASFGRRESPFFNEEFINPDQNLAFVHVGSTFEFGNGILGGLWYGGPYEYCHDNKIYFSSLRNGSWLAPRAIMTSTQVENDLGRPIRCLGNPLMLPNADGSLELLFVTIAMGRWSGGQLNRCVSKNGGLTWSRVERLTLSPLCNFSELVRNRPIPLAGGGWCVPIYQEFIGKFPELLWLKDENGKLTARKSRITGGCAFLQPTLIPLGGKKAIVLLRDWTKAKRIFVSRSQNGGFTWSKTVPTNLPNPDAGISGLNLADGKLLVAFNDSTSKRENLSLALSRDGGDFWQRIFVLNKDPDSYPSYPFVMKAHNGLIYVAYTDEGDAIKLVNFNEEWIDELQPKKADTSGP